MSLLDPCILQGSVVETWSFRSKISLMSRWFTAALLVFGLLSSLYAQRGGMHAGGGGMRGGFGGGHAAMGFRAAPGGFGRVGAPAFAGRGPMRFGGAPRPMGFGGPRPMAFAGRRGGGFVGRPRASFVRPRSAFVGGLSQRRGDFAFRHNNGGRFFRDRDFDGDFDDRFHHHHFNFPFFYAFPYYYSGAYFDPFYDDYSNPYYSFGSYSYDPTSGTSGYTDLSNEVGNLDAQVQQLRDENDSLQAELDESRRPPQPTVGPAIAGSNEPSTLLVFKDGHRLQVQNYAVVGQTLWILSPARANKIPLADLDLNQTIKINEARGVEFLGPAAKQ